MESDIGQAAGKVWRALRADGAVTKPRVVKATGLSEQLTDRAIGWSAREGKLAFEKKGKSMIVRLRLGRMARSICTVTAASMMLAALSGCRGAQVPPVPASELDRQVPSAFVVRCGRPRRGEWRLPGEFEEQGGLLLSGGELVTDFPELFAEIVERTCGETDVHVMVSDLDEAEAARKAIVKRNLDVGRIRFLGIRHDTMWARDYGPLIVQDRSGDLAVLDGCYGEPDRQLDETVPENYASDLGLPVHRSGVYLEGGYILSNGDGLMVTTTDLLERNGRDIRGLGAALRQYCGARRVAFLEPMTGEPTGHVDMFATFTDAETIVIGAYDRRHDPENAEILDRNARLLSSIRTRNGRLKVVRITMPKRVGGTWRTFTNLVYANNVVLVPIYSDGKDAESREALSTLERLLPGRKITPVRTVDLASLGGALHCLTMNLGPTRGDQCRPRHGRPTNARCGRRRRSPRQRT